MKIRITILGVFVFLVLASIFYFTRGGIKYLDGNKLNGSCAGKKCNVVLIYVDTLSSRHLSGNGYFRQTSPFIDEFFLNQGLVFKKAVSNATWTVPSFSSMFKSKLASDITVNEMINSQDKGDFVDYLRETGIDIKAVLRNQPTTVDQAIDPRFTKEEIIQAPREKTFEKSSEWLKARVEAGNNDQFFMLIHSWDVHHPFDPPEPYRSMFGGNNSYKGPLDLEDFQKYRKVPIDDWRSQLEQVQLQYDQGIRKTDDYIRGFIEEFPKEYRDNTVFILTADHGEGFAQHDNFVGHAFAPYQEIISVPLSIVMPGNTRKIEVKNTVSLIDLAPTILDTFNIDKPQAYLGRSLLDFQTGSHEERLVKSEFGQSLWLTNIKGLYPENEGENLPIMTTDMVGGILGKWKVMNFEGRDIELFDLEQDPNEQKNLVGEVDNLPDKDKRMIKDIFDGLGVKY